MSQKISGKVDCLEDLWRLDCPFLAISPDCTQSSYPNNASKQNYVCMKVKSLGYVTDQLIIDSVV